MNELSAALKAAEAAGVVLRRYFCKPNLRVRCKEDGSPCTVADVESEKAVMRVLRKYLPTYGFVCEESGTFGDQKNRWIVDPLDGTRSFTRGLPFFGTLIALEKDGVLKLGVISLPALGETLYAIRGKGCFWNGRKARSSGAASLDKAFILMEIKRSVEEGFGQQLLELASRCEYVRGYSDVYAYFLVATGQADAFIEGYPHEWDVAAPKVILEEAGGFLVHLPGKNKGLAVASNRFLFRALQRILKPPQIQKRLIYQTARNFRGLV